MQLWGWGCHQASLLAMGFGSQAPGSGGISAGVDTRQDVSCPFLAPRRLGRPGFPAWCAGAARGPQSASARMAGSAEKGRGSHGPWGPAGRQPPACASLRPWRRLPEGLACSPRTALVGRVGSSPPIQAPEPGFWPGTRRRAP